MRPGSEKDEWILEKSVGGMLPGVTLLKVSGPIITAGSFTVFPLSERMQEDGVGRELGVTEEGHPIREIRLRGERRMEKTRVFFVCVHNSARSQMAEAFLNSLGGGKFIAESVGIELGVLNPRAVQVMKEVGIDIAGKGTNSVFEFFKQDRKYR